MTKAAVHIQVHICCERVCESIEVRLLGCIGLYIELQKKLTDGFPEWLFPPPGWKVAGTPSPRQPSWGPLSVGHSGGLAVVSRGLNLHYPAHEPGRGSPTSSLWRSVLCKYFVSALTCLLCVFYVAKVQSCWSPTCYFFMVFVSYLGNIYLNQYYLLCLSEVL